MALLPNCLLVQNISLTKIRSNRFFKCNFLERYLIRFSLCLFVCDQEKIPVLSKRPDRRGQLIISIYVTKVDSSNWFNVTRLRFFFKCGPMLNTGKFKNNG